MSAPIGRIPLFRQPIGAVVFAVMRNTTFRVGSPPPPPPPCRLSPLAHARPLVPCPALTDTKRERDMAAVVELFSTSILSNHKVRSRHERYTSVFTVKKVSTVCLPQRGLGRDVAADWTRAPAPAHPAYMPLLPLFRSFKDPICDSRSGLGRGSEETLATKGQ